MPSTDRPSALRSPTSFILAAGLLAATAAAATDTTLRLQGQLVNSSADALGLGGDFGSGPGAYLGAEFRLNDRFGIEVGIGWLELEESQGLDLPTLTTEITASLSAMPVTVALDIHLTRDKPYDLYLAPKIGWAFFDDFELISRLDFDSFPIPGFPTLPPFPGGSETLVTEIATEDQFLFGLRLGFDFSFGDGAWSFSSSIDYTDVALELDFFGSADLSLDPLSFGAGVAYNF